MRIHCSKLVFAPLALVTVFGIGNLQASAATINACVNKFDGIARIVHSSADCLPTVETFVSWNQQGPAGLQGPIGPTGATGPQGPAGAPGAKGAMGATGAQGVAGPAGPVGATGAKGATGAQGVAGPAGPVGATGAPGAQGPAGAAGAPGAAGPTGPTGPIGPAGPAGPAGTTTLPANLTALSNQLGTSGYSTENFKYTSTCTIGDMILSVNSYGSNGNALPADGRLLTITSDPALFSILGTRFGGDGTTNFALPDLRSFAPNGLQYSICVFGIFPSEN